MNIQELDPGIRGVVTWLRLCGFETTDSGDGVSKTQMIESGDALPFPNVFMKTTPETLVADAKRLLALTLRARLVARIEASYDPTDGSAVLALYDVADSDVPVPR